VQLHCRASGEEREGEREREDATLEEPGGQTPPFVNAEAVSWIQDEGNEGKTQQAGAEG